jgi:hypothetical protein
MHAPAPTTGIILMIIVTPDQSELAANRPCLLRRRCSSSHLLLLIDIFRYEDYGSNIRRICIKDPRCNSFFECVGF